MPSCEGSQYAWLKTKIKYNIRISIFIFKFCQHVQKHTPHPLIPDKQKPFCLLWMPKKGFDSVEWPHLHDISRKYVPGGCQFIK